MTRAFKIAAPLLGIAIACLLILGLHAYQAQKAFVSIGPYEPQVLGQTSPWSTEPYGPLQQGEMTVCAGNECANIKAQSGDQLLIGARDNIAGITVNGVPVHAERRGYDIVITAP